MKLKIIQTVIVCLLAITSTQAQKYLVLLKDKTGTPFSTDKPEAFLSKRAVERRLKQRIAITQRDLPVNPAYVSQIRQTGAKIWFSSRWINGVLVEASAAQLAAIKALACYKGIEFNRSLANARLSAEKQTSDKFGTEALDYGASQNQILMLGVDKMHDQGFHGEGMLVGILDAGFQSSDKNTALNQVFTDKRVLSTFDFVKNEKSVYEDDSHGNNVFSIMASNRSGQLIGPAYGASYVLLRTEDAFTENRVEEANWLFGAEYADSAGVDIINSSLGYNEFDNPADNYTYADMNGRNTLAARAADWAAATGMVVVVSAGNEGNKPWKYIATPGDADSVLTVGAVASNRTLGTFSSIGPSSDGRVKPDVCAQGVSTVLSNPASTTVAGNGTSYSSPLIAGFVAGFWQAFPYLTALQVIDCIRKAGHLYTTPNAQFGYGIPTFEKAAEVARRDYPVTSVPVATLPTPVKVYPNPFSQTPVVLVPQRMVGQTVEVYLIDATGQVRWQNRPHLSSNQFPLLFSESLPSGLYFLKIADGLRVEVVKVIKQ